MYLIFNSYVNKYKNKNKGVSKMVYQLFDDMSKNIENVSDDIKLIIDELKKSLSEQTDIC